VEKGGKGEKGTGIFQTQYKIFIISPSGVTGLYINYCLKTVLRGDIVISIPVDTFFITANERIIMPRSLRMKIFGDQVFYHLYSRTAGQEFFLGEDYEKQYFLELLHKFSSIFFIKLISFSIMDNHFHLVVKSEGPWNYSEEEIKNRIELLTNKKADKIIKDKEKYKNFCRKLGDISEFMKYIKQNYTIWYNRTQQRSGYLWGGRYKNVLLEPGKSVLRCCSYIELNPVRASMEKRPDNYRWNSLYARVNGTPISKILHFHGIYNRDMIAMEVWLKYYRKYVYISGGTDIGKGKISKEILEMEEKTGYKINESGSLKKSFRHFTDGTAIGGYEHIKSIYKQLESRHLLYKKDRNAYKIDGLDNSYCLRRLKKSKSA